MRVVDVPAGDGPESLAINETTNRIYVANHESSSVTVIDGASNNTRTIKVSSAPYDVEVNQATNKIYVANRSSQTVSVIDGTTEEVTDIAVA